MTGIVLIGSENSWAERIALLESYDSQKAAQAELTNLMKKLDKEVTVHNPSMKAAIEKERGLWLLKVGPLPEATPTPDPVEVFLVKYYPNMILYRNDQLKISMSLPSVHPTGSWVNDRKLFGAFLALIVLIGIAGIRLRSRHLRRLKDGLRRLEYQIDVIKARLK